MAGKEILQPGDVRCLERLGTRLDAPLRKRKSGLLSFLRLDAKVMAEGKNRAEKPEPRNPTWTWKTGLKPSLCLNWVPPSSLDRTRVTVIAMMIQPALGSLTQPPVGVCHEGFLGAELDPLAH